MNLSCVNCGIEKDESEMILIEFHYCQDCADLKSNKIYNMDCLLGMKQMEAESVDLIVTDPPYGISFMNKKLDIDVPSVEICKEMLRVLKHGAFAFVLMSPRQDVLSKMINNLHEAGFETNFTSLYWAYASGFPKAMNISKAVDKNLGFERDKVPATGGLAGGSGDTVGSFTGSCVDDNALSPEAQDLDGSYAGFQPKPAVEVVIVAMKPLSKKSYISQAMDNQKGITWLDDARIPFASASDEEQSFNLFSPPIELTKKIEDVYDLGMDIRISQINHKDRFPANLICGIVIDIDINLLIEAKHVLSGSFSSKEDLNSWDTTT